MNEPSSLSECLACPRCKGALSGFYCSKCLVKYPLVDGVPILINEENSIFRTDDFLEHRNTTYKKTAGTKTFLKKFIPSISLNIPVKRNLTNFYQRLTDQDRCPRVLVIGGAVEGRGMKDLPREIELIETDVSLGPRTSIVCDGLDLPFLDASIDGVIVQAVLEHVIDPWRCVSEIQRVLKPGGLVYAETPFMQQVHAGRYDFTRFTHLGHRHLFRYFDEIDSGPSTGAATALVWAYCYFLQGFFRNKMLGKAAFVFGSITGFWLKYLDYILIKRPNAYDAASAYYFFGSKSAEEVKGKDLIKGYKGLID